MRVRFLRYFIWIFIITGCTPNIIKTYEGETKRPEDIGIVTADKESPLTVEFNYFSKYVVNKPYEWKSVGGPFAGYSSELQMLPGRYIIMVHCSDVGRYGFPMFVLDVEPGKRYYIQCDNSDEIGKVKAYVRKTNKNVQR